MALAKANNGVMALGSAISLMWRLIVVMTGQQFGGNDYGMAEAAIFVISAGGRG